MRKAGFVMMDPNEPDDDFDLDECVVGYGEGLGREDSNTTTEEEGNEIASEIYETIGLFQLQFGPPNRTLAEVRGVCLGCVRKILGAENVVSS